MMRIHYLLLVLLLTSPLQTAQAAEIPDDINYLLEFVATSGCTFHRNGGDHAAADAADHLRLKYSRGKRYVSSAEEFIDRLASESSWSGDPYTVTCNGETRRSAEWLHRALAAYQSRETRPATP